MLLLSTENWKQKLLEVIDPDQLPAYWGGTATEDDGADLYCQSHVSLTNTLSTELSYVRLTNTLSTDLSNVKLIKNYSTRLNNVKLTNSI